jgi:hypothetical protein
MRAKLIESNSFERGGNPRRILGIGESMPDGFIPVYVLKKQYPGMDEPIGTIFGKTEGWACLAIVNARGHIVHNTEWELNYFEPWVGKFFEKI